MSEAISDLLTTEGYDTFEMDLYPNQVREILKRRVQGEPLTEIVKNLFWDDNGLKFPFATAADTPVKKLVVTVRTDYANSLGPSGVVDERVILNQEIENVQIVELDNAVKEV